MKTKKIVSAVVVLAIVVGGIILAYRARHHTAPAATMPTGQFGEQVNLNPPTPEEKQAADDNKQAIVNRDESQQNISTPNPGTKSVTPDITYAGTNSGSVEISAIVPDLFEDSGTCQATLTNGDKTVSKTSTAVPNAKSMSCPVLRIPTTQFPTKGSWKLTVHYTSNSASGVSATQTVEVQ